MRVLQAAPRGWQRAIEQARVLECEAIAWTLTDDIGEAAHRAVQAAGLVSHAWLQAARDPAAIALHPEWMHCPQHHEWLTRFPGYAGGHPAVVAPYLGLNTQAAFQYALANAVRRIAAAPWAQRIWLADIQGPPMGCGCGNPSCRSWDNAPGPKLASTPYDRPELLFPLEFCTALCAALPNREIVPVLCPECERHIVLDGVPDGRLPLPCRSIERLVRQVQQQRDQNGPLLDPFRQIALPGSALQQPQRIAAVGYLSGMHAVVFGVVRQQVVQTAAHRAAMSRGFRTFPFGEYLDSPVHLRLQPLYQFLRFRTHKKP